jgi:hypothetical protein
LESAEGNLSVREAVLLVLDAAGGHMSGRTVAQKLSYFAAGAIGQDLGHRAHYFGPYSRQVEASMSNSSFAGDLEESVVWFGSGHQYHYRLTDQGREAVKDLRARHRKNAEAIARTVTRLGQLVPGYPQHWLSLAAKVDLIIEQHGGPTRAADIPKLADELGWHVSPDDVARAVEVLVGLDRVTAS